MIMKVCSIWYLLNLLLLSQAIDPCPTGWTVSDVSGTCLKLYNNIQVKYVDARKKCQQEGADLIIVSSEKMDRFVRATFSSIFFIGLNDLKEEGNFTWLDYSEKAKFTNWNINEPKGIYGVQENCVIFRSFRGEKWDNVRCDRRQTVLCEKPIHCPPGYYGRNCSKQCDLRCSGPDKVCMDIDGNCTRSCGGNREPWCQNECSQGKHGVNCEETCSFNCVGKVIRTSCDKVHGECRRGCVAGYRGTRCNTQCPQGKYGKYCRGTCSINCVGEQDTCNRVHGECKEGCVAGYKGKHCNTQCPQGKYGKYCRENCSINCVGEHDTCDRVHGECREGCVVGYTGKRCNTKCTEVGQCGQNCSETHCLNKNCSQQTAYCYDGCEHGWFGPLCNESRVTCSYFCKNRTCDDTGECTMGCKKGFTGPRCRKTKEVNFDFDFYEVITTGLILVTLIFPLVLAIGYFMEKGHGNTPQSSINLDESDSDSESGDDNLMAESGVSWKTKAFNDKDDEPQWQEPEDQLRAKASQMKDIGSLKATASLAYQEEEPKTSANTTGYDEATAI